jgi:cytochrome P450
MRITAPDPAERVPLDEIDLYSPESYRDGCQHAAWRTLRQEAPVWWHERPGQPGFWCVTRQTDVERVLKEHRTFSSASGTVLGSVGVGDPAGGQTISLMDPPDHTPLRTTAMRSFSHSVVREKAGRIREQVRCVLQPCREGEQDFARLMMRLPMAVSGEIIGIPEEHWDPIAYWTAAGLSPTDPAFAAGPTVAHTLRRAHHELFARFSEMIAHRRRHPGDDLISGLLALRPNGRPMEDGEVLLNCYSFMAGANSTTPHVAAQTVLMLIEHPRVWTWLRADPGRVPAVVEEGVRWTGTPHHLVRRALADTELAGVRIAEGDWVCAWTASANRDEAVFDDPYRVDPTRPTSQHIGFGVGPHYCVGAPLSRYALRVLLTELVTGFDQLDLVGPVTHLTSNWVNGVVAMPVLGKPRH